MRSGNAHGLLPYAAWLPLARHRWQQQRSSLQEVLAEGERCVPSTTVRIMYAIQCELQPPPASSPCRQYQQGS